MHTAERRSARFPFYASAEITEAKSQTKMTARTSELSRHGCYVDMLNPFPIGMFVKIVIVYREQSFEATGRVLYSQRNMGMGVGFDTAKLESVQILEKWLEDLNS
jgi:hypothetical protein